MRCFSSKTSEVALFVGQFSLGLTWPVRITWALTFDPKLIPNEISHFPQGFLLTYTKSQTRPATFTQTLLVFEEVSVKQRGWFAPVVGDPCLVQVLLSMGWVWAPCRVWSSSDALNASTRGAAIDSSQIC